MQRSHGRPRDFVAAPVTARGTSTMRWGIRVLVGNRARLSADRQSLPRSSFRSLTRGGASRAPGKAQDRAGALPCGALDVAAPAGISVAQG